MKLRSSAKDACVIECEILSLDSTLLVLIARLVVRSLLWIG
ncbi:MULTISPECIES: hypothetical protein [unclassified Microcoleus]|nr:MULTISPECIES: hypothetical protein [unclassified Microcoleus]